MERSAQSERETKCSVESIIDERKGNVRSAAREVRSAVRKGNEGCIPREVSEEEKRIKAEYKKRSHLIDDFF